MSFEFEKELEKFKIELSNIENVERKVVVNISEREYRILKFFNIDIEYLVSKEVGEVMINYMTTDEEKRRIEEMLSDEEDISDEE